MTKCCASRVIVLKAIWRAGFLLANVTIQNKTCWKLSHIQTIVSARVFTVKAIQPASIIDQNSGQGRNVLHSQKKVCTFHSERHWFEAMANQKCKPKEIQRNDRMTKWLLNRRRKSRSSEVRAHGTPLNLSISRSRLEQTSMSTKWYQSASSISTILRITRTVFTFLICVKL